MELILYSSYTRILSIDTKEAAFNNMYCTELRDVYQKGIRSEYLNGTKDSTRVNY